jgi:tagaturonate reductase
MSLEVWGMLLSKQIYKDYRSYPERVLQFGSGNFLRGFADWVIDVMNKESNFNGSVVVVQSTSRGSANVINEQDGLFTLYLKEERDGRAYMEHSVVNSISRSISTSNEYAEYLKLAQNPDMRFIISNTTEAGIIFDEEDQLNSKPQSSFPGKLTAFLYNRFKLFDGDKKKGFIVIPCELIDRNGDKLKEYVLKYAEVWKLEKEFIEWIQEANTFCCSLVDRVISGFPKEKTEEVFSELGYEDNLLVEGEFYHQWIIEAPQWIKDEFPCQIEGLNVKIVDNMNPYRTRKVNLLNGAHTVLTPVAYLYGLSTVRESVEDEVIGGYIRDIMFNEVIPTLDMPLDELQSFAAAVLKRFKNPAIKHELMSISLNSISKFEARVLPTLLRYLDIKGELPRKLIFSLAALIKFYSGKNGDNDIKLSDNGEILELFKENWDNYDGTEASLRELVINILGYSKAWKMDLNNVSGLTNAVTDYLIRIEKVGMEKAIKEVL